MANTAEVHQEFIEVLSEGDNTVEIHQEFIEVLSSQEIETENTAIIMVIA